jgi:hypothetical protein
MVDDTGTDTNAGNRTPPGAVPADPDGAPGTATAEDTGAVLLDVGHGRSLTVSELPAGIGDVGSVEELRHNKKNAATFGIWRVTGSLGSAVLKVFTPPVAGGTGYWPTSDEPTHWNHWRREWLAYRSGMSAGAFGAAGVAGPDVLAARERADGRTELWLADVEGTEGFDWSPARLARFAHELGVGQARFAGRVPDVPWLSRGWLAQYLAEGPARSVDAREADWAHPGVAVWPAPVREGLMRLWAERDRGLAVAQSGERTLCHLDVWPANLIDDHGRSVLLDWSFIGAGAVGEDIANLVLDSFTDGLMDPALLPEIVDGCVGGYVQGLRDGGWSGSEDGVRAAVAACGAAKYSWFGPAVLGRVVKDDVGTSAYSRDTSADAVVRRVTGLITLITDWARTATG